MNRENSGRLLTIVTSEGSKNKVDSRFYNSSTVIQSTEETEEIELTCITKEIFFKIYNFYKKLDFQIPEYRKEITSSDLNLTLPKNILFIFDDYINSKREIDLDKIKDLIDACYIYDFFELKDVLLIGIGSFCCFITISL